MAKGQAERLVALVEDLLKQAGITWRDLTAIGVGTGPGNFTGIRISVALARGLSLGLGIPAIGVDVFDALAHGLPRPFAVVQDARRDEVYVRLYDEAPGQAVLVASDAVQTLVGNRPVIGTAASTLDLPQAPGRSLPLAQAIALVAKTRVVAPQPRPVPFYMRGADAAPPSDPPPVILDA